MARVALLVGALVVAVADAQHHSWSWFYSDMCGCTETKFEGCGVSSAQLFKVLTDSHGLQLCTATNGLGDTSAGQTAEEFMADEKLEKRIQAECEVRQELKRMASAFEVCHTLKGKEACAQQNHLCEWEAQDIGECGIDEEKLLHSLVPQEYHSHPLLRNILIQDRCSEMPQDHCLKNSTCTWDRFHNRCNANDAILWSSFLQHPAMFQILEIAEHGASCRGWHEHVWHGSACWENHCHLERGICTGNAGYSLDDKPNATTIREMKNTLCREKAWKFAASQGDESGESTAPRCPPGCREQKQDTTATQGEHHGQGHGHGGHGRGAWPVCEADGEIEEGTDLTLSDMDTKIALYFLVIRSATYIHESRCNSLDNDITACKKVATDHIDCQGMFYPNATEIFKLQHHERHDSATRADSTVSAASTDTTVAAVKKARNAAMETAVSKVALPDAGVGVNGGMDEIVRMAASPDKDEFFKKFSDFVTSPELEEVYAAIPDLVQGFRQIWQDAAPTTVPPTSPPPPVESKAEDTLMSHAALLCIGCLVLAGICGGYAWGVLMTNNVRNARGPALLETEYMRHTDPQGAA